MTRGDRLDSYHFYEQEWDSYGQLREAFEWEIPDRFNIATYICDRWADDDRVALYAEDAAGNRETFTFSQLRAVTNRLANYLDSEGIGAGDTVGVNVPQRPETLIAYIACWKLGAVPVPLSTLFGPDALRYRLDDADAVATLVDESNLANMREARAELPALGPVLTVGDVVPGEDERDLWSAIEQADDAFEAVETAPDDDALLIYTSGTTGDPKGVRHSHQVALGHLPLFVTAFANMEMCNDDVLWTPAEWAWMAMFNIVICGLFYGKPVVAYDGGQFDPEKAFEIIDRYDVSIFFAPATALRLMGRVDNPGRFDVDSVRTVPSGGESLEQGLVEWALETFDGAAVHEGFGQTEANMLIGDCTALAEFQEGYMGLPAPGHEVTIVNPDSAEPTVETSEIGEIAVRYSGDPVCFEEYWQKPEKTASKVENGWLLTEDLGWVDDSGHVAFKSRKDDVIISAGYRIGPDEVEESVAGHDAVIDVGVIGVPNDERGEVPKAFVVLAEGREGTDALREDIKQHVRDRLAKYEYPREISFVEELPQTVTGKVRRESLREREVLE